VPELGRGRTLLWFGAAAGPLYVIVAGAQALAREGFDPSRHAVSLLSNGAFGWVQILNFVVVGTLVLLAAAGLRRVPAKGVDGRWVPRLVALYGTGLVAAGIFVADPAQGFPPGTPEGAPETVTWQGALHFAAAGVAFLALVAACLLFARRSAKQGQGGWSAYSLATGCFFLAAWIALVATAGENRPANVAFALAVVAGWLWFTAVTTKLARGSPKTRKQG
jgi:hypothetical membrane protein